MEIDSFCEYCGDINYINIYSTDGASHTCLCGAECEVWIEVSWDKDADEDDEEVSP